VLQKKYETNPYLTGIFRVIWNDGERKDYPTSATWIDKEEVADQFIIRVYEKPLDGYAYVIGGDTHGDGDDNFTGTVINNTTGNRAATLYYKGKNSKLYASQMWALAMHYNKALLGIEVNWNTYPIELMTDWHYPRQYQREKTDTFTGEVHKKYGWKTDGNTRPLIIEREATIVREDISKINDIPTLDEMLTFVENKDGKPDAESGKHDDLLMSEMIAEGIRSQQTREVTPVYIDNRLYPDEDFDDYRSSGSNYFD